MAPPPMVRRSRTPRSLHRRRCCALPHLMNDIITEILLRFPPDDPSCLARASAVCRTWRRIVTGADFTRRYRAFHRTPPLLGVFRHRASNFTGFIRTTATSFQPTICRKARDMLVLDCRHGRVLLYDQSRSGELVVWDPTTGDQHPLLTDFRIVGYFWNAAVVCAAAAGCCDHHSCCRGGPFRVVSVATLSHGSDTTSIQTQTDQFVDPMEPATLIGYALYFSCKSGDVLRYDMIGLGLSVIDRPPAYDRGVSIMRADDGGLGFAGVDRDNRLHLGLRKTGPDGVDAGWAAAHRIIDLKDFLPLGVGHNIPTLMGVVDGAYAIFANTDNDVFIIELKSLKARKVCKHESSSRIFPYLTFYTPGLCK